MELLSGVGSFVCVFCCCLFVSFVKPLVCFQVHEPLLVESIIVPFEETHARETDGRKQSFLQGCERFVFKRDYILFMLTSQGKWHLLKDNLTMYSNILTVWLLPELILQWCKIKFIDYFQDVKLCVPIFKGVAWFNLPVSALSVSRMRSRGLWRGFDAVPG